MKLVWCVYVGRKDKEEVLVRQKGHYKVVVVYFLRMIFGNVCVFSKGLKKQFGYCEGFHLRLFQTFYK